MDDLDEEGDSSDEEEAVAGSAGECVGDGDEEEEEDDESDSDDEAPMYNAEDVDIYNEFSATMRDGVSLFNIGSWLCHEILY